MKQPIEILLADDHRILRTGLKLLLSTQDDFRVVAEASDGREVLQLLEKMTVDVILLDLSMPGMSGLVCLQEIRKRRYPVKVLVLTMYSEQQYVKEAMQQGADGFLCKDTLDTELFQALHTVASGRRYLGERETTGLLDSVLEPQRTTEELSSREYQVLEYIVHGYSQTIIAEKLNLSIKTVSTYKTRLMKKLDCTTNAELVDYALQHHLLQ
ncbi:MAG: response regulator transcription factor [Megasphaera sp.]|jgi:DNA-binding NarL/FixJ family response regulator|nr:response regulator transcription factor [Megasphaera sp.]MCH4188145.1 response regulator transcription factor [Megasphaera sp.]MCH4217983.1 response regulator transcription factor [Megasphaera sp.]